MICLNNYGFVRVGSAVPEMKVGDCGYNTEKILELMEKAVEQRVYVTVFPELCITGYSCGDLFGQSILLRAALESLERIMLASSNWSNVFLVGLPLLIDQQLYNCAAVVQKGRILGVVPKTYLPNSHEFYEKRWFHEGSELMADTVTLFNAAVPCGADLVFQDSDYPELCLAIEICQDMWMAVPPSSIHAINGAVILCNLSASNELIGKHEYRELVVKASREGVLQDMSMHRRGESTTDLVSEAWYYR